jgi:hypothetical protein
MPIKGRMQEENHSNFRTMIILTDFSIAAG